MNGIGRPQLLDRPAAGLRVRLVPDGDVALRPFVDHPVAGRRLGELVVALDPPLPVEQEEVEPDGEDRVVGRSHHVPVEHGHVTAADRVAGRPEPVPGVADELLVRIADAGHDRVVPDRLAGRRQVRPVRSPQPLDASAAGVVVRLVPDFDVPVNEVGEVGHCAPLPWDRGSTAAEEAWHEPAGTVDYLRGKWFTNARPSHAGPAGR